MNDRELLELAAKAAGIGIYFDGIGQCCKYMPEDMMSTWLWNPLTDDGDALRLAVKLNLDVFPSDMERHCCTTDGALVIAIEPYGRDKESAVRRSIVRAAAEIGKGMP